MPHKYHLTIASVHLVLLAKATFWSDFTSLDADFDSAIINLVGSSSQPEFCDLVTQGSELNHDFAQWVLDFALQQNYEERTQTKLAVQSSIEADNSPPNFDLPLFSISPSLAPVPAQHMVTTTGISPVVVTSPAPLQSSILVPPSATWVAPFIYQPIQLPTPPPIPLTLAQDLGPSSQGLVPPPSTITPSSSQRSASLSWPASNAS